MARTRYIPEDADRLLQAVEEKAERRALRKGDRLPSGRDYNGKNLWESHYEDVGEFIAYLEEEEETSFDFGDLNALSDRTGIPNKDLRETIEAFGFTLAPRAHEVRVRTFADNPHDRWYGPGSSATHGGGGGGSLQGLVD